LQVLLASAISARCAFHCAESTAESLACHANLFLFLQDDFPGDDASGDLSYAHGDQGCASCSHRKGAEVTWLVMVARLITSYYLIMACLGFCFTERGVSRMSCKLLSCRMSVRKMMGIYWIHMGARIVQRVHIGRGQMHTSEGRVEMHARVT
jgi:hypothetical protein